MRYVQGKVCDFNVVEDHDSLIEAAHILSRDYDMLAFDTETTVTLPGGIYTDPYACKVRLMQVGFPNDIPILIDTYKVDPRMPVIGGTSIMDILGGKNMVAHNATYDYKQVKVSLDTNLSKLRCSKVAMQSIALASGYKSGVQRGFSYLSLCRDLLSVRISKELQASNWGADVLTDEQLEYAALDVGAPRTKPYSSMLLKGYSMLKWQSDKLGMQEVWDLRQDLVPIVGDMELHGLLLDTDLLSELGDAVRGHVSSSTLGLCEMLGLEVFSSISVLPNGNIGTSTVPTAKSSRLLNHNAGLLKYINKAIKEHGVELEDLKEESLKPHGSIPIIGTLLQYNMYHKLLGDIDKYKRSANLTTGCVHSQTNIIGTSTGRMSNSSDKDTINKISIQQMSGKAVSLPSGRKLTLQGCVRAKPGKVILDLDFAGQELCIAAAISGDERMLNTFILKRDVPYLKHPDTGEMYKNPDTDLHLIATKSITTYSYLNDLPPWEVLAASEIKGPDGKSPRSKGKVLNFLTIYGASPAAIAGDLGVSQKEAEGFQKEYFNNFSGLKKWLGVQEVVSTDLRYLTLPMGAQIFTNEANSKGKADKGAISRRAGNIPIQGTGALMMAKAVLYQRERLGDKLHHLALIHDGALCEIPLPNGVEAKVNGEWHPYILQIEREAKQCMLDAEDYILSPMIGAPFPCAADSKLSMYWSH
jgi:DNA polymerase I-like protein with 3'-5' exonuclease and polymerase domains